MKYLFLILLFLTSSCSFLRPKPIAPDKEDKAETPMVTVHTALEHIKQSYTLGCVEALRSIGKKKIYPECLEKGKRHSAAVRQVLETPDVIIDP